MAYRAVAVTPAGTRIARTEDQWASLAESRGVDPRDVAVDFGEESLILTVIPVGCFEANAMTGLTFEDQVVTAHFQRIELPKPPGEIACSAFEPEVVVVAVDAGWLPRVTSAESVVVLRSGQVID